MKTSLLALAGAAAASPLAGRDTRAFSLQSYCTDKALNGSLAVELHSTDYGDTPVVLLPNNGTAYPLHMDGMFILGNNVAIGQPVRSGGSEFDYLTMGPVDTATGVGFPQAVPAGYGPGWSVINYTNPTVPALVFTDAAGTIGTAVSCATTVNGSTVQQLGYYLASDTAKLPDTCTEMLLQVVYEN